MRKKIILIYGDLLADNGRLSNIKNAFDAKADIKTIVFDPKQGNCIKKLFDVIRCHTIYVGPFLHSNRKLIKIAHLLKKRIVVDFYASFYDMNILDRKLFKPDSREAMQAMNADRYAIENADVLIFLNEAEKNYYLNICGCETCADKSIIVPLIIEDRNKAKMPYWNEKRVPIQFVYCGNYIPLHGIENILGAAKILAKKGYDFKIRMWGNEATAIEAERYKEAAASMGIEDKFEFVKHWEKNEYFDWCINNCDCFLGVFGESEKAKTVVPNKVIDGIAFGVPVITGYSGGLDCFFDLNTDILSVGHNADALCNGMISVINMKNRDVDRRIEREKKIFNSFFSKEHFSRSIYFENLYQKI